MFCYDYSGFGCSNGKTSESNTYADIRAAYNFLIKKLQIPWYCIIPYGQSIGTGPTIDLATDEQYPVSSIILEAPMISGRSLIQNNVIKHLSNAGRFQKKRKSIFTGT